MDLMEEFNHRVQNQLMLDNWRMNPPAACVAAIPWIPQLSSKICAMDVPFFKEMIPPHLPKDKGERRLYLYRLLNHIFPFYLPKRYHTMDCKSLHENSKNGQYWANASHFLFCNLAHEQVYFFHLRNELKEGGADMWKRFKTIFDVEVKDKVLKDGLIEQCESAAEFLLEPWVLLQLPFQPVLIHQWAVALLAEALLFYKEISDFFWLEFPKRLEGPVQQLFQMYSTMLNTGKEMLSIFDFAAENASSNMKGLVGGFIDLIVSLLPEVLPVIEFVTSPECSKIVKSMKQLAWRDSTCYDDDIGLGKLCPDDFCFMPSIYNLEFWRQTPANSFLFHDEENYYEKSKDVLFQKKYRDVSKKGKGKVSAQDKDILRDFVNEKIIKTGRVQGESKEKILKAVDKCAKPLMWAYQTYNEALEFSSRVEGPEDTYNGVIYDLIRLHADAELSQAIARMVDNLVEAVPPDELNIRVKANEAEVIPLSSIELTLSKVKTDDKWSYENIMERVKATCFSSTLESSPDYKQGAEKVASHFQERIRNLVFKMIERQYKTLKENFGFFYPERLFLQYMLPCFVTTFLEIDKCPPFTVGQEEKEKYLSFVHELVSSYERFEFAQKMTSDFRRVPFSVGVLNSLMDMKMMDCMDQAEMCLKEGIGHATNIFDPLFTKGLDFLIDYHADYFPQEDDFCPWTYQMFMFLSRIQAAFKNLGWLNEMPADKNALNFMMLLAVGVKIMDEKNFKPDSIETLLMYKFMGASQDPDVEENTKYSDMLDHYKCEELVSNIPRPLRTSTDALTNMQIFGLAFYHYVKNFSKEEADLVKNNLQHPAFPLDPVVSAISSLTANDFLSLKQQMSSIAKRDGCEDLTLASLQFGKSNLCYESVLKTLTAEGRVEMSKPGEITFFPIKHCRWCGRVDLDKFRVCPECEKDPEYPDLNFFCSKKCEVKALKEHSKEHCKYIKN